MIYRDTSDRLNKYDNLKGLAIILVVFSHFIGFANENPLYFLHNFIHMIHLPIFFFVAGYFSKISKDLPIKSFKRLLIPFIVFCILYALYNQFILGESTKPLFVYPGMGLWFLISLFTMKMMLPIMDKLRYPVLTAFILSVFTGFLSISEFGLSRTFAYMPIFQ